MNENDQNPLYPQSTKDLKKAMSSIVAASALSMDLLVEANSICRTMAAIVERRGTRTNWNAFEKRLKEILEKQHRFMYPDNYQDDKE